MKTCIGNQLNATDMERQAKDASELLLAMANATRLMVLCHLLEGPKSVNELAESVDMSQSAVSQHLAKLRGLKLVATEREAQTIYYSLASDHVRRVLMTLYEIYCS